MKTSFQNSNVSKIIDICCVTITTLVTILSLSAGAAVTLRIVENCSNLWKMLLFPLIFLPCAGCFGAFAVLVVIFIFCNIAELAEKIYDKMNK